MFKTGLCWILSESSDYIFLYNDSVLQGEDSSLMTSFSGPGIGMRHLLNFIIQIYERMIEQIPG